MTVGQAPLVPANVDLTDFGFMPLDVRRLRDSRIAAGSSGDEFRAAVLLWCAAWHQKPAASIPDDDIEMSQLAGFGRVVKEWRKVKDGALHGWIKCSDGRWYHPVVAEKAIESWNEKLLYAWSKECDRIRKENKRREKSKETPLELPTRPLRISGAHLDGTLSDIPKISAGTSIGIPAENALKGQGQGQGDSSSVPTGTGEAPTIEAEVFRRGKALLGAKAGGQITKLRKALMLDDIAVLAALREASGKENPAEWIAGVLKRRSAEPDTDELGLPIPAHYDVDEEYRRLGVEGFGRG